ncbi:unnamed protein product [Toxocara canis]|uniref:Ovule protein n=1 Tax=Toxocara canis TaxID=6265 RepID=A0A183UBS9_TOXCA|nr:unnamed protein product [Toxocara canis]
MARKMLETRSSALKDSAVLYQTCMHNRIFNAQLPDAISHSFASWGLVYKMPYVFDLPCCMESWQLEI